MQKFPEINNTWKVLLQDEFNKEYFQNIKKAIQQDLEEGITLYPPIDSIFNAFSHTSFDKLKVVILGQDPYHGPQQAHGLSFSVQDGIKLPPSLKNIYKELESSLGVQMSQSGNLIPWADQGVLLLNAVLSVRAGSPASHAKIGWEDFTDSVIKKISDKKKGVVFLLWGAFAQGKKKLIDTSKHHILETTHPSPFSAYRGFLGSNCFKQCNEILQASGQAEINWKI